jgi:hypothetical protein
MLAWNAMPSNPQLKLRKGDGWQPVREVYGLDWIHLG